MTLIRLTAPVGGVVLGLIPILLAAIPAGRYRTQPGRHLIRLPRPARPEP